MMESLKTLSELATSNLTDAFSESFPTHVVTRICNDIIDVITAISSQVVDEKDVDDFCKNILPRLSELLFRRKTLR